MKTHTLSLTFLGVACILLAGILLFKPMYQANGSAFTGSASYLQVATTSSLTANTNAVLLPARTDGSCKARVVTVPGAMTGGVNLIFGDKTNGDISSTTLSGTAGHYQAASTTVVYDSGLYGCGMMVARSWTSGTVVISEF